ncbi:FMN1 [Candida pseudojiufengensis]|uniref:FMN1 n=1 Tax=Candida pseudojiufengensis TaxID=497109 RepID=UPI0022241AE2|nr:FMN1 [Candida pseudojiufengensis]KAI5961383.1 FMN1 [Candida pseudojiufengensis]
MIANFDDEINVKYEEITDKNPLNPTLNPTLNQASIDKGHIKIRNRPETIIHDKPQPPFPIHEKSSIISGFGRGSSELGIPTANIPIQDELNNLQTGIFYGWSKIHPNPNLKDSTEKRIDGNEIIFNHGNKLIAKELCIFPMVMSIGWNPFYDNKQKAAEIHIINKFNDNFYGAKIEYIVLGYIRPELNYTTKEALIKDINLDIKIAKEILSKPEYEKYKDELKD